MRSILSYIFMCEQYRIRLLIPTVVIGSYKALVWAKESKPLHACMTGRSIKSIICRLMQGTRKPKYIY